MQCRLASTNGSVAAARGSERGSRRGKARGFRSSGPAGRRDGDPGADAWGPDDPPQRPRARAAGVPQGARAHRLPGSGACGRVAQPRSSPETSWRAWKSPAVRSSTAGSPRSGAGSAAVTPPCWSGSPSTLPTRKRLHIWNSGCGLHPSTGASTNSSSPRSPGMAASGKAKRTSPRPPACSKTSAWIAARFGKRGARRGDRKPSRRGSGPKLFHRRGPATGTGGLARRGARPCRCGSQGASALRHRRFSGRVSIRCAGRGAVPQGRETVRHDVIPEG